jgi:hypothetical protein
MNPSKSYTSLHMRQGKQSNKDDGNYLKMSGCTRKWEGCALYTSRLKRCRVAHSSQPLLRTPCPDRSALRFRHETSTCLRRRVIFQRIFQYFLPHHGRLLHLVVPNMIKWVNGDSFGADYPHSVCHSVTLWKEYSMRSSALGDFGSLKICTQKLKVRTAVVEQPSNHVSFSSLRWSVVEWRC